MHIRKLKEEDAEQFLELNKQLDDTGYMLYDPGERQTSVENQRKGIARMIDNPSNHFLVAVENESLIGFIAAFRGNLNRNKHSAYLVLGVDKNYRGRGIASMLFEEIFFWSRNHGITRLELTVIKHNQPAFNLYSKMGFILEGEKIHSLMIEGEPVNEYYMYKLM
ncbi:GNAT family N-acetyltransferase [Salinicoccus sp. ID82-1]|uniref:GNAT family N-acetyltransferase n=1 Tax=Salinicoccus sp. ID82-1 TaxID=2820269 RepID=UPI001F411DD2|nr:GNAT family N-acetyltransferase [Salinicoccus sp. ID82-1]MCG1010760.1 GNAT family N-acetyltransferase [Salinicoccus sp. ID82-1]